MNHFSEKYIGQPYRAGFFNCWDFVRQVYKNEYGISLNHIPVDETNLKQLMTTVKTTSEHKNWRSVKQVEEGDLLLMRQSKHPIHVGVWVNIDGGGVLHCIKNSGVVFQNKQSLQLSGWKIEKVYRYAAN